MSQSEEDRADERLGEDSPIGVGTDDVTAPDPDDVEADSEELGDDEEIDITDFEAAIEDLDDPDSGFAAADEELSQKEQNARSLAVRRAIEQRMEQKQLDEDLDYLDLDPDE